MKLNIKAVIDNGTHGSEKVLLEVVEDADLKYYILRDTTYTDEHHISNKWQHIHKFLEQSVKKGDEVVLYTKKGKAEVRDLSNSKKQYIYYWGLDNSVWNNDGDAAVLYELKTWDTFKVKKIVRSFYPVVWAKQSYGE